MSEGRRIGILGGTFDPIHCGHIDLGMAAQRVLRLTSVLVVPANVPPHRPQPSASAFHRFAMVALSVAGRSGWRACDLELQREAPSYTSATLRQLHRGGHASQELFFVLGADAFVDIGSWRDFPELLDAANFAVVSRPGFAVESLPQKLTGLASRMVRLPAGEWAPTTSPAIILIDAPTADLSSTAIRRRRSAGQSLTGLVTAGVEQHIEQHGLYIGSGREVDTNPQSAPRAADRLHGQS